MYGDAVHTEDLEGGKAGEEADTYSTPINTSAASLRIAKN